MKVGTDAILLSVWCDVTNAESILDIGTGSGVIALLMAARSKANVDAIELDKQSVNEATENFERSQYNNRLKIYNTDFIDFMSTSKKKYDLIISNPPFFSEDLLPENQSRKAARHINKLSHNMLCKGTTLLLSENGKFCIVLPIDISSHFIRIAATYKLYLNRQQIIYPKPNKQPNRVNMEFSFHKTSRVITEKMLIRSENGVNTDQYKAYVSKFLIN